MECNNIGLNFNYYLTLEQVSDESIINMLDYINYRLLYITSNKYLIMIRNVNDN